MRLILAAFWWDFGILGKGTRFLAHVLLIVQNNLFASEQHINLFKRQVPRLRVEEVGQRDKTSIEDGEINICFVTNAVDRDWSYFNDQEGLSDS